MLTVATGAATVCFATLVSVAVYVPLLVLTANGLAHTCCLPGQANRSAVNVASRPDCACCAAEGLAGTSSKVTCSLA